MFIVITYSISYFVFTVLLSFEYSVSNTYNQITKGVSSKGTTPLHVSGVPRTATGAMTICKALQTRQGSKFFNY